MEAGGTGAGGGGGFRAKREDSCEQQMRDIDDDEGSSEDNSDDEHDGRHPRANDVINANMNRLRGVKKGSTASPPPVEHFSHYSRGDAGRNSEKALWAGSSMGSSGIVASYLRDRHAAGADSAMPYHFSAAPMGTRSPIQPKYSNQSGRGWC